jgi:hypothetical protein
MADQSEPKSNTVAIVGLICALALFAVVVACLYYLPVAIHREIRDKQELAPTAALDAWRAEENRKLNQPEFVDKEQGIVRIPIALAMQLEARRSWREDLPLPASTFPTTATLPASAPTTSTQEGGRRP